MNKTLTESFSFWLPISKASDSPDGKSRIIEGIASTPDIDLQNERVQQRGIDFNYFMNHGYFNWDHKPGAENKIGEPWECKITSNGLYVKGILYKGKKVADNVWEHITSLASNSDAKRKVGFSLQGKTVRRNGNSILKCWIQDIAITTAPINYNTYLDVVKSLSSQEWEEGKTEEEEEGKEEENSVDKTLSASNPMVPESLHGDKTDTGYGSMKNKSINSGEYTKKSLAHLISNTLGYSQGTSNILADVLFDLSAR